MIAHLRMLVPLIALMFAACASPEQQMASDRQRCEGFGYRPGSDAMADCMAQTAQTREARAAAQARQDQQNKFLADQLDKDREQKQRAADQAAADQRYNDWLRMSGHGDMASPAASPAASSSDDGPIPSAAAIPGMQCSGTGDDAACDALSSY